MAYVIAEHVHRNEGSLVRGGLPGLSAASGGGRRLCDLCPRGLGRIIPTRAGERRCFLRPELTSRTYSPITTTVARF
jgi:hypothetical protein